MPNGQQIHVSTNSPVPNEPKASRHPCFKLESKEKLVELRKKIWEHFEKKDEASPREADKPGEENSGECDFDFEFLMLMGMVMGEDRKCANYLCLGAKGVEYPTRFFARDYAGNRLEFSL